MAVRIRPLSLANPVMPASGCFGPELGQVIALDRLGALVTKTVFSRARSGNPAHRLTESSDGMLNAVGIPSTGKAGFVHHLLPGYPAPGVPRIVSIGGLAPDEYWTVTEQLDDVPTPPSRSTSRAPTSSAEVWSWAQTPTRWRR